jgi:hypothetical protein
MYPVRPSGPPTTALPLPEEFSLACQWVADRFETGAGSAEPFYSIFVKLRTSGRFVLESQEGHRFDQRSEELP